MTNWCENQIIVMGDNKETTYLYEKIKELANKCGRPHLLLKNILKYADISSGDYHCYGEFEGICMLDSNKIRIDTYTAWFPMVKMWKAIVDKYTKNCKMLFYSTEPSVGIYETNDIDYEFFKMDYVVEWHPDLNNPFKDESLQNNEGYKMFSSEDFIECFRKEFNMPDADTDSLIDTITRYGDRLQEANDDAYLCVNKVKREKFLDIE